MDFRSFYVLIIIVLPQPVFEISTKEICILVILWGFIGEIFVDE